jgi:hypothetical protein
MARSFHAEGVAEAAQASFLDPTAVLLGIDGNVEGLDESRQHPVVAEHDHESVAKAD